MNKQLLRLKNKTKKFFGKELEKSKVWNPKKNIHLEPIPIGLHEHKLRMFGLPRNPHFPIPTIHHVNIGSHKNEPIKDFEIFGISVKETLVMVKSRSKYHFKILDLVRIERRNYNNDLLLKLQPESMFDLNIVFTNEELVEEIANYEPETRRVKLFEFMKKKIEYSIEKHLQ